jgi:hypothetical protein
MPLTRLDNLISSKTGKYLYVSPDDFNATDALSNRGNSPVTPFKSIQRAFLEIARYSYLPGFQNDRFDQFSIMLMPGIHYIDNRPGLVDTSGIDVFGFDQATNAWTDDSILDISNPDNVFYKFNNTEGGAIIPRGSSLVGYDLRRTVVRPMYVPDPATTEREIPRSAIFNVTGGCYFWQFTIKDGQTTSESPLYDNSEGSGLVYYDPKDFAKKSAPNFSHHKLTVFEYADTEELSLFYRKIAKGFSAYQPTIDDPGEFDFRVQENRIVGPLSDSRVIESLTLADATTDPSIPASTAEITVTTKVDHGYFAGQFVAIANTEIDDVLEGIFQIKEIDQNDARKFKYEVPFVVSGIGSNIVSGQTVSVDTTPALGQNAQTLAEVDSVESASPYVFNVSIRSTWGICGIWANGLKATGFKSMVIAQYTGVSLQKDDRAFIRYDEYTNTWNQASLVDAFATVPYHTKGDSYWKDEWRNFHVRASDDAFIQNVSIFAVGFADHFLMESGGDMSITNSNSNFGNTSLHAIGFKGFAFNQDKGGFITDIIPPEAVVDNTASTKKISYYTIDIQGTLQTSSNYTKLFLGNDDIVDPLVRPAATITGYRLGAKSNDRLYVKLDNAPGTDEFFNVQLEPTGFVKYVAKGSILNPSGGVVNSVYADAANLIESNRRMIQEEVFGYILEKYPRLQNIPYVNPGLNPAGNRYFDARNLIAANRQEIVDTAFDDMITTYGSSVIQGIGDGKCKRDIGLIVDAVAEDLKDGGNSNVIAATRTYFDGDGNPLTNGLVGEEDYATYAFRRARDLCKLAIANLLTVQADLYDPDPNSNLAPYGINVGKTGSQAELDGDTTNGVTIDLALKADPASRYKDARNRIVANREFILDAALAEVSVYHPDFYIPGDTQTNSQSRLADGFRMIRRNSSEIRDKALAAIAVAHPNFYIDGDNQTDEGSRYASAYRLIANNRNQIIDVALAETTVQHPDYYFVGDQQTDARSRYADGYRLIQQNKTEIVNTAWTNTLGQYAGAAATEVKCKRDMGIFVDSVSLDLFVGGNKYARKFIQEYFNAAGNAWISGGLQGEETESIYAFNQARDLMKSAVANQLSVQDLSVTPGPAQYAGGGGDIANTNAGACDDVQSAITTLVDIVTTQIAAGNLNALPAETAYIAGPGEEKCRRDIGIFVDSIALDLFCKGNVYTHRFGAEFFTDASTPEFSFNSAVYNTNFNKAAETIKKAITNQLYEKDLFRTADNAPGSAYGQVSKDYTPHGATYDAATGDMVLSIANHGLSNGDRVKIADSGVVFTCTMDSNGSNHAYPRNTDPASGQYLEITASTTDSITVNVGASPAGQQYDHTFVSAVANCVNFAGNTANQLIDAQTALCSDVQSAVDSLTSIVTTILSNGNLSTMPIEVNYGSGRGPGELKCARDIGYFIDAISVDMFCEGNKHTRTFTEQYFTNATTPLNNGLVGEEAESVTAFNTALNEMKRAVTNQLYYKDLTVTEGESQWGDGNGTVARNSSTACADVQNAITTLGTIATDAITAGNITGGIWNSAANAGTFITGEAKCRRDLGIVVDAVAQDLWFGGNEFTIAATKEYFNNNALIANGVDAEVAPSITAFKRAEDLMQRALNNVYYDRDLNITLDQTGDPPIVGDIECDAHDMVTSNLDFIAEEAYLRMIAAYPAYTPQANNTAQDCKDDVITVLKEVMWDVKFGGNYKTYDAAKIYVTNYDYQTGTNISTFLDAERDEAAKVMLEAKNIAMQVIKNETVTVDAANTKTQVIDNTIVEDWDATELLPKCGSAVAAVDTLFGIVIQAIGNDGGVGNLDGVVRTTLDGPDPAWNKALNVISTTATSVTLNVGASASGDQYPHTFIAAAAGALVSGGAYAHTFVSASADAVNVVNGSPLTPINATYDAATGDLTLYFGTAHGVTTSDQLSLDNNSLTFSCDMGRDSTTKTYPRAGSDPVAGQNVNPTAVTATSITINVGASPLVEHNVSNAVYDSATGSIALTIGAHTLTSGTSVKLKEESLIFKCTKDQNVMTHSYPRASGKYRPAAYADGNCSDVLATVNALIDITCNSLNDGNLNNLPPLNNGEWDCANVRSSIEVLFDILQDAIVGGTLAGLPPLNTGDFTINNEASKCFRDVTYIVDAVVNDLRLGGNLNSIQAGEAYYVGNNLEYIDGEKTETLDAWNYVGQMATAAMRNFDVLAFNCSTTTGSAIVDVNDTRGIIIGMGVKEYDDTDPTAPAYVNGLLQSGATQLVSNIPAGTYVKNIVSNTQIELGVNGSRLTEGNTVNALQTSTTTELYFVYENGIWADTLPTTKIVGPAGTGEEVIQDTTVSPTNRECSGTANAIETLVGNITTIINSGLGTVTRQEQTVNTALLASRATVFTIDVSGSGPSNPHDFETGTAVRLVPRPRFDQVTGKYVDVDKRLVRLPNGFDTNRTYYVIAPGRVTQPENYGGTSFFDGSDQTRLMLATSRENAASGIYIYASETDSIDKDVEIDLYQFVLDDKYDLHNYTGVLSTSVNAGIQTDVSHIFDVPNAGTTPQKAFIRAVEGGVLPLISQTYVNDPQVAVTDPQNSAIGRINPNIEFFTRYQNNKTLTLHKTHADAINNVNPITFAAGQSGLEFNVYANKSRSPMRFDPGFTDATATNGKWYIQCKDEVTGSGDPTDNIFWRISQSDYADRQRSTDMWYERLEDNRDKDDRTYKLRMVIPKYLENARDPINGFVLKTRTDDTRKLVPQKVVLKPVVGTVYGARFENPVQAGEYIGYDSADFNTNSLNLDAQYDPFKKDQTGAGIEYRAFARFTSGIQATIQSGRYVEDVLDPSIKYLELNLYDHAVDTRNFPGLRNETFTTVKITAPQGGNFVTSKVDNQASSPNAISFAGNSSGLANVHAYYTVNGEHYLIIKNVRSGDLEYSEYANTRFTQGTVFADMLEDQDMGKSLPLKTQIRKNNPQFFYKQNGANVYTITPGDRIQDDAGVEYYVDSVEDAGVIEDTFYIFGYETLQKRISGQQDGIYYLTALRGNVSPFPTGAGVTNNFKKFKFSQPVSKLYPLNYRNDPLWFKKSGTSQEEKDLYAALIDPPQVYSAADNYVHGLVTVNDFKNSTTREMVADLTEQPAFLLNTYTGGNTIQAQSGNATSGSEDRRIPISGDSTVLSDQRYYVELRRPSIARAGNHTFEYLGFGPGNYSTGLPARQEVVLTPEEDFYAQSKKQDAGIVFYTGINSQGDLYIGNRRINAITGEETFIDSAALVDDGDEDDTLGGLVTTFDTPVTFNQNITVVGGDGELVNTFESPITIAVQDSDLTQSRDALIIRSNVSSIDPVTQLEQDEQLDRTAFAPPTDGDIRLGKNRIQSAIFGFNSRGNGQEYKIQTHTTGGVASNVTPNQSPLIANGGSRIDVSQFITYGGVIAAPGDMLLKGAEVGKNGSIAWILSNYFSNISNNQIDNIEFDGTNVVKLSFRDFTSGVALSVGNDIGITSGSQIRIKNFYYDPRLNLTWQVYAAKPGDAFNPTNNYCHFQVIDQIPQDTQAWENIIAGTATGQPSPTIEFSNSNFKEFGVIGAEALRTETESIGEYKLGINTVARAPHSAYANAWVNPTTTDPRANLDVVGNAFISGRVTGDFLDHTNFADRDKTAIDNALLIGGDSSAPNDEAVLRVATTNGGRVGINVDNSQLDRALVVDGTSRFTDDARFEHDIEVNGDDGVIAEIRTSQTTGTFNLVDDTTFTGTLNIGSQVGTFNLVNDTTDDQFIYVGTSSTHSNIFIGTTSDTPSSNISKVEIGGGYNNNESLSFTRIKTKSFKVDGDFQLGARRTINDTVNLTTSAGKVSFFSNSGSASILDFALNASEINIAGQGGLTTINNQLRVVASAQFDGNILMCGGVAAFSFLGDRAQLGSTAFAHADGILSDTLFNKNIDILNVLVLQTTDEGYNQVDTAGAGLWGGAAYQQEVTNIGGAPAVEPQTLGVLTGDEYWLPLKFAPVKQNGDPYFVENDYIIINSAVSGSGHPEIVQVLELTRTSVAPYYLKVKRQPLGTYTAILNNHIDTTPIFKVNVQFDATWTEQALDSTGPQDNVYLSEFGGVLTNNDYVIIDREDTNSDGIFNQGEVIKVVTPLEAVEQKFRISKDCSQGEAGDVFIVNSVTGDTTILGDTTINNTLTIKGGCGTLSNVQFNGTATAGTNIITGVTVTSPDKTIADIKIGDTIVNITNESPINFSPDAVITAIDSVNGELVLSRNTLGSSSQTVGLAARRNEQFLITDGNQVPTFRVDSCSGTTHIGNQYGRFDIEYSSAGETTSNTAGIPALFDAGTIKRAYSFWFDPQHVSDGGPTTTIASAVAGSASQIQIPVQSLGVGSGAFAVDDLVFVGSPTATTTQIGDYIIGKITQIITNPANLTIVVEDAGTGLNTNKTFTPSDSAFDAGNTVRRLIKHKELANIIDVEQRTRVNSGASTTYISMILDKGYISQQKLDYAQFLALADDEGDAKIWVKVVGRLKGDVHQVTMNEQIQDGAIGYRSGNTLINGNLDMAGGSFQIFDSVNQTRLFALVNDDGHADHQGLLTWDAGVTARGDFYLFSAQDPENVVLNPDANVPSFSVDNLANVTAGRSFTVNGLASNPPSTTFKQFALENLGVDGTEEYAIKQDSSIDAFGITNFTTSSGARHTRYISSASPEEDLTLVPNITYMVNTTASTTLVLTLPSGPQSGDIVRITDVGGNLSYNTSLVLRTAESSGTKIQGDDTGTLLGGRITPYPSGELVVQTPNAAFALVYLGSVDSNGQVGIPTSVQGWWLTEV